jgi:hypothetical protein
MLKLQQNFILVGCILLRYVYVYLSNIYLQSQLRIYWCYFYGTRSVNGENKNNTNKFSVAIAGIYLKGLCNRIIPSRRWYITF